MNEMKLSRKFVSDYIDLDKELTIKEIAEAMTAVGNEYDSASALLSCTHLVVGEILECVNHPDSDHLHVCKVDVGSEILTIVCGAPNCRQGLKVIVALAGAQLPAGEIKKGVIRGVASNGMLCAKSELGLDSKFLEAKDKEGIHELSKDAIVGSDPIALLGLDDEVIDFELTANRGDLLSILGMAYELGAIYKKAVKEMDLSYHENEEEINNQFKVEVQTEACPLFLAKKVTNVTIKESPDFIKNRLIASGIRPINNVVDISNYVMLETGQPLHFYDAKQLGDTLIVRDAFEGEELTTLDKQKRVLSKEDIVIANREGAVGLAGVMGGLSTEVEEDTEDILIEAAIFDSIRVRKTSKKILRSEASNRFEKGLDPKRTYMAIARSCTLLEKYADATIIGGMVEYNTLSMEDKVVEVSLEKVNKVLGLSLDLDTVIHIFESLGFSVEEKEKLKVTIPTRRMDIHIEEDLIEEVGRMYGMDKIKGKLPLLNVVTGSYNKTRREMKNKLVDLGLNETLSYSLIPKEEVHTFTNDTFIPISLADPMSEDRNTLRYSILYSLKEIYLYNQARNQEDICIFEIGKGFYKEDDIYKEENKLAVLMTGDYYLDIKKTKVDFYIIKGVLEELLDYLGYQNRYTVQIDTSVAKEFHPGQSASILLQGKKIGVIGKLHPNVVKKDVYAFEISLDKLFQNRGTRMRYKEIPKYPEMKKDLAFIVKKSVTSSTLEAVIKKAGGKLLKEIEVFDVYTGENVGEDEKSIAYTLTFTDSTRTLTEEEVNVVFKAIIKKVEETCKATLRDK